MYGTTPAWICLPGIYMHSSFNINFYNCYAWGYWKVLPDDLCKWYIAILGLHLLRPVSRNFIGQALLAGMNTHILLFSLLPSGLSFNSYCSFKTISDLRNHLLSLHFTSQYCVWHGQMPTNSNELFTHTFYLNST